MTDILRRSTFARWLVAVFCFAGAALLIAVPPTDSLVSTLTAPTDGQNWPGSTFQWTAIAGADCYYLYVGTAVGTSNVVNTGELQVTFCFHQPGKGGGAGHEDVDFYAWHISKKLGVFVIDSASDPNFEGPTPIPAAPGHYSQHPAPGVAIEITVAKIPNR